MINRRTFLLGSTALAASFALLFMPSRQFDDIELDGCRPASYYRALARGGVVLYRGPILWGDSSPCYLVTRLTTPTITSAL